MARIAGIQIQDKLKLDYALTLIKGIGWSRSKAIIKDLGLKTSSRVSDLSSIDLKKIVAKLSDYSVEGDLERSTREDTRRLRVIGSYRGLRHQRGLPARGQRTKSNARTKRGKRKTVGAFKKAELTKQTQAKKE